MSEVPVSIAMATHNGATHLAAQLESIAAQTRAPTELVAFDDASQDDTVGQLEAFASRAPFRVQVERNPTRVGTTRNFQAAIELCRGDIVFLADQDDVWLPEKIATHLNVYDSNPDLGACFSNGSVVDEDGRPLGHRLWNALGFSPAEQRRVEKREAIDVFLKHVVAAGTTLSFRSKHLRLALPFPDLRSCHDAWIAFMIAATSSVGIIPEDLILYRMHESNQIGLGKASLGEQIRRARLQLASDEESGVSDGFAYAVRFFEEADERLRRANEGEERVSSHTFEAIRGKIDHARCRSRMPQRWITRLPTVVGEAVNRNYWRYSYGFKSIAQDLWLR